MAAFKKIHESKTIWCNVAGLVAVVILNRYSIHLNGETIAAVFTVGNVFLRLITKHAICWTSRGAFLHIARYIDQFGFKWRDVKHTQSIVSNYVQKEFKTK